MSRRKQGVWILCFPDFFSGAQSTFCNVLLRNLLILLFFLATKPQLRRQSTDGRRSAPTNESTRPHESRLPAWEEEKSFRAPGPSLSAPPSSSLPQSCLPVREGGEETDGRFAESGFCLLVRPGFFPKWFAQLVGKTASWRKRRAQSTKEEGEGETEQPFVDECLIG